MNTSLIISQLTRNSFQSKIQVTVPTSKSFKSSVTLWLIIAYRYNLQERLKSSPKRYWVLIKRVTDRNFKIIQLRVQTHYTLGFWEETTLPLALESPLQRSTSGLCSSQSWHPQLESVKTKRFRSAVIICSLRESKLRLQLTFQGSPIHLSPQASMLTKI